MHNGDIDDEEVMKKKSAHSIRYWGTSVIGVYKHAIEQRMGVFLLSEIFQRKEDVCHWSVGFEVCESVQLTSQKAMAQIAISKEYSRLLCTEDTIRICMDIFVIFENESHKQHQMNLTNNHLLSDNLPISQPSPMSNQQLKISHLQITNQQSWPRSLL